jgi:outer membrane protein assembly factor BamB
LPVIREIDLATPVDVSGVPIYAAAGWAAGSEGTLYFLTDGRLIAPSAGKQGKAVHADHFNSNTLFAFDGESGKLLWQWKLTTTAQGVAAGNGVVAVSTQQSYSSDDPMDYGVTMFDASAPGTPVEKMRYRYPTAGPVVALAVSPDGKTVAAVEAPVRLADGVTVIGKYRLHILR